jgi:predicted PurR-regulated permease PerM
VKTSAANLEHRALWLMLVGATLALGWILLPFYGSILWGSIIALLFAPLYRWLLPRLRQRRTLAALLTLGVVLTIVIVPAVLVMAALAREATLLYLRVQTGELNPARYFREVFDALPGWATALLDRFGLVNFDVLQTRLNAALVQGSQYIATQAYSLGQNTFEFLVGLGITLYLAFFLIRDGAALVRVARRALPLDSEHTQELIDKFGTVIRATVKGNLLVAAIQGALGGLAFWTLGVGAAVLWGVLMAFLSLLPAVGAALVWLPVAIWFLVTGSVWQGLALTAYGLLVIGLIDNLLRPLLVGRDTRLPDYVVMLTTLGGMAVLGINGFVLGPVVAAMFVAVWHLFMVTRTAAPETPEHPQGHPLP